MAMSAFLLRAATERRASELASLEARMAIAETGMRAFEAARGVPRALVDAEIDTASRGRAAARRVHAAWRASSSTVEQVVATLEADERALSEALVLKETIRVAEARALASANRLRELKAERERRAAQPMSRQHQFQR